MPGMCFCASTTLFDMMRDGHIDRVILGACQVSEKGDLANCGWPGRPVTCMGGGMDLAVGAKKHIVTMPHTVKDGIPRIKREYDYPIPVELVWI
jgi:3-oxoacid CoA-transferase B subunit